MSKKTDPKKIEAETEATAEDTSLPAFALTPEEKHRADTMVLLAKFPKDSDHHNKYAVDAARALGELGWKTQINEQGSTDDPAEVDAQGNILTKCLWVWKELQQ